MKLSRRRFLSLAGAVIAAPAVSRVAFGQAPQVTLTLHHFLPPVSNVHTRLLAPWAKKVGLDSGGRIQIDIFPSMQLGGTPPQLFDQARDGVADIVCTLPGAMPGRFPGVEMFELAFVAGRTATTNAKALQEFYQSHLRDEFKEVQPICVWAHDRGLVHASRQVRSIVDLKGLKLRPPTRFAGEALKALGATSIPMPISQVPDALAQKVIDGCVIPWEIVPALKVQELVKFHTDIPGSPTLQTATFVLAMNKPKYESLPDDLKQALDANSGQAFAAMAGKMWDEQAVAVEDMVRKRGNTIAVLAPEEVARWRKATEPVIDAWIKQSKERGLDGGKLLENARAVLAKYANA